MAGSDRRLVVNVGGTRYTTSLTTLLSEENSFFTGMLGGDWAETDEQELFIDRDGELFKQVLRFLRASQEGRLQVVRSLTRTERALLHEEAKFCISLTTLVCFSKLKMMQLVSGHFASITISHLHLLSFPSCSQRIGKLCKWSMDSVDTYRCCWFPANCDSSRCRQAHAYWLLWVTSDVLWAHQPDDFAAALTKPIRFCFKVSARRFDT